MAEDFFGYDRETHQPGKVLPGSFALLDFGGRVGLASNVRVSYGHVVNKVREIGSDDVFLITGDPSGTLDVTRTVGPDGFLTKFKAGSCGYLEAASVTLGGKGNCRASVTAGRGLRMRNLNITGVGVGFGAGSEAITENMQAMFTTLVGETGV